MDLNGIILASVAICAAFLLAPKLAKRKFWQATVTPLASIIGSGFLVLGPILGASYGKYALLVMAGLCLGAYLIGTAIRYNIATIDKDKTERGIPEKRLDIAASWALVFAYIISVAYYLNLFGAFGVNLTAYNDGFHANLLTSAAFLVILFMGWLYGFKALERMEQLTVSIKLAIIAGLLVGLGFYFQHKVTAGLLTFNPPTISNWAAVTLAFGLIVTVQGFETSRYLGDEYDAKLRIKSMRASQVISTAIYMIYIGLLAFVFKAEQFELTETAIIDLMKLVAPVLPALLVAAALSAQFSAAVADTGGSGGLMSELTNGRLTPNHGYGILIVTGLILTWTFNVFEIISYASRAFAVYYALQCAIAALAAWRNKDLTLHFPLFVALCVLCTAIVVFGVPVE